MICLKILILQMIVYLIILFIVKINNNQTLKVIIQSKADDYIY